MKKTKWAIRGTGYIAQRFAQGMAEVEDAELAAVVSRTESSGRLFAEDYCCTEVYTDFETMLKKADIDIIYLATPNDQHFSEIMLALDYKIPVLSEKPIVDNSFQMKQILDKAREQDVFLMEGMWSRFFPAMKKAAEWVKTGLIGEPLYVYADFSYAMNLETDQPWKAGLTNHGGALRDVGIYSLAFADLIFPQNPRSISTSMAFNGEVDERMHLFLEYGDAKAAFLSSAFTHEGSSTAEIVGTLGKIQVGPEFWRPTTAKLIRKLDIEQEFVEEYPATGFQFEIMEVQRCLRENLKQSPFYTHDSMCRIANLIERVRKDWGILYYSDF